MSEERKRSGKMSRFLRRLFFRVISIAIAAAVLGTSFFWVKNTILARQVQVVAAQEGSLDVLLETDAVFANTETVITAPAEGKLERVVQEGERVRKGGLVARLNSQARGSKADLYGPISGVVSYYVDGLEGILTPKNLAEWDYDKFAGLQPAAPPGELIPGGQGVFKLIDNLQPTYILFKLPKPAVALAVGDKVNLALGGQKLSGKVLKISRQGPENGLVAALPSFLPQSLGKRETRIVWLDNPAKGVIIPLTALLERQGNKGVFVLKDGVVTWQGIDIEAESDDKVCVKNGLKVGTIVITTPANVKEGQVINARY